MKHLFETAFRHLRMVSGWWKRRRTRRTVERIERAEKECRKLMNAYYEDPTSENMRKAVDANAKEMLLCLNSRD